VIDSHGRGSGESPPNPFERLHVEDDLDGIDDLRRSDPEWVPPKPTTQFFVDDSQSVIAKNNSPDIPYDYSLNPYRGCEHGCAYCYARRTHEYLGWNAGIDFESRILVKENAAELLQDELHRMRTPPVKLNCSGVTDPYQPVERSLGVTRACLEVLVEMRQAVTMITKNHLVTRDIDLLAQLASHDGAAVGVSINSLDRELAAKLEPRASSPRMRLRAVRELNEAGVPAGIMLAPVIPGLNDHEIPAILDAAAESGARFVGYTTVRLPGTVAPVFEAWLREHFSAEKAESVLDRIRATRGGKFNINDFGDRLRGTGELVANIKTMIKTGVRRHGLDSRVPQLSNAAFRRVSRAQPELF
jgi:DNA repair photolyase